MNKISIIIILFLLTACGGKQQNNEQALIEENTSAEEQKNKLEISRHSIKKIMQSIPSPLETAALIRELGGDYNPDYLNNPDNISKYNTTFKQTLNFGVYGTDLGYVNIYAQNKDALAYLNTIRDLAQSLSIGQYFDYSHIKKLATNKKNFDSLMYISTANFQDINEFLHEQNRSAQSVLILTGGWVEAMHITCKVAQNQQSKEIHDKIGEQKVVLNQLIKLMEIFDHHEEIKGLLGKFKNLHYIYQGVVITKTYQESTTEEKNGRLVVVDKSTTDVKIKQKQVDKICKQVRKLRSFIVK